jgi:ParB/RepB/Spo0J family partition protein
MSTQKDKLEVILIDQIELSVTNPRKKIDVKALSELAESIKEHGVLQPILVRPYVDEKSTWQDYQLVCGERRYRAAKMVGLESIPANVRVLTDDEAFELQIVENLERKDVHPLYEADAFKKMLDSGKYSMFDIAAKMAKSETFIAQRLKLVDLIDEVREDFLAGHLGIGHAILIARCNPLQQKDIYDEAQPYREGEPINYGTIHDIKEVIERDSYILDNKVVFPLDDETLLPEAGACSNCPKRSGCNPVLFSDMQDADRCFDEACFDKKEEIYIDREAARIINEGLNIVLVAGYGKISDMITTLSKQFEVNIIQSGEWVEDDGRTSYNEKWQQTSIDAFTVSGSAGRYIKVFLKKENESASSSNVNTTTGPKEKLSNEAIELKDEIQKIKDRQARALELDSEKVWTSIRAIETIEIKENQNVLLQTEINALCFAMLKKMGFHANRELLQSLDMKFDVEFARTKFFLPEVQNMIVRAFIIDTLPEAFGSLDSSPNHAAYEMMLQEYFPADITKIKDEQEIIADKRIARANERIKELEEKILKLTPAAEEPAAPAVKKSKAKKA